MIEFDKATHRYFDGGKELISVTALMRKHGLAPDYSMVPKAVLEAKAERGTLIHKEIEEWIKEGKVGFTQELGSFIDWSESAGISAFESETILHNDIVAGTCDLMYESDGVGCIADIKTTSTLHKESVSWQLSIYNLLGGWKAEKGQAFHFDADGNLKVIDIPLKPKEEVERLMECEREGKIYEQGELVTEGQLATISEAEAIIQKAEAMKAEAQAAIAEVRGAIIKAMEANGTTSFENDRMRITYVAPYERATIDTAKLKRELPKVAEEFTKRTMTEASLRIKLKGEAE